MWIGFCCLKRNCLIVHRGLQNWTYNLEGKWRMASNLQSATVQPKYSEAPVTFALSVKSQGSRWAGFRCRKLDFLKNRASYLQQESIHENDFSNLFPNRGPNHKAVVRFSPSRLTMSSSPSLGAAHRYLFKLVPTLNSFKSWQVINWETQGNQRDYSIHRLNGHHWERHCMTKSLKLQIQLQRAPTFSTFKCTKLNFYLAYQTIIQLMVRENWWANLLSMLAFIQFQFP